MIFKNKLAEENVALATAEEILKYAEEEFEKAIKTKDMIPYRKYARKLLCFSGEMNGVDRFKIVLSSIMLI